MSANSRPIPTPTAPSRVDRLIFPLFEYLRRDERASVSDPRRMRRMLATGLLTFGLVVAAVFIGQNDWGWATAVAAGFIGLIAGRVGLLGIRRTLAYRHGWLEGRHQMIVSLHESAERGMTLDDWLRGELERDVGILSGGMAFMEFPPREREDGDE